MRQEIKERIEKIRQGEVPEGYKKTKVGVTPIDWEVKQAKDIFKNISNKNHDGSLEVLSVTQDRGVMPRSEVNIDIKYNDENLQNYKKIDKGDFVISLRSFQGGLEYSNYCGLVSPAYTIIRPLEKVADNYFKEYFKSPNYIKRLNVAVYGIRDGKQISYSDFGFMQTPKPPILEQQKIADILTKQDEVVELKEKLLDEKKQQKKYLMQQLLTGEKRLPGFDGKWTVKKLGDVCICKTSSISMAQVKDNDKFPVYDANKIVGYLDNYISNEKYISIIKDGAGVGRICKCLSKSSVLATMAYIYPKTSIDYNYLYCLLGTINFDKYKIGSTIPHIYFKDYKVESFNMPSIEEQQAIADILTTADKEIELLEQDLEQEKQKKKALMQLLLTGIVRVKV